MYATNGIVFFCVLEGGRGREGGGGVVSYADAICARPISLSLP